MDSSLNELDINDNEERIHDEAPQVVSAFMVRSSIPIDPPADVTEDAIEVKAHFEYSIHPNFRNKVYAIADGDADFCILVKYAKVLSHTGRYAILVRNDQNTAKT